MRTIRCKNPALLTLLLMLILAGCSEQTPEQASVPQAPDQSAAATTASTPPAVIPEGRLPQQAVPQHYALELTIDPEQEHFSGRTKIELAISQPLDDLWLHGNNLHIKSAELTRADGTSQPLHYSQETQLGLARLTATTPIAVGAATLEISYQAPFNDSLEGLYRVKSGDHYYAFTQFEASSARLAFPGFDEPAFKVPFDISLITKAGDHALANTPELEVTDLDNGMRKHRFVTSKALPTYLIAFAVGPFDVVTAEDLPVNAVRDRPLPLRGVAVQGKGPQLAYALQHTNQIVSALENYFQIPYPYAKLDIIAVPDFAAGAMENAGIITYREQLLLLDEHATAERKFAYASVHAHELAHQWFGNLVTPVWWDDIWLNEAFATWMAAVTLDSIDPEGGYRRSLLQRSLGAMGVDSLTSVRQIRQPIESDHDIASAFDAITYSKGGGVLAMFERFLGRAAFRQGIQQYLQQHAWGNATADDFINAIADQAPAGQEAVTAQAFRSFLTQPGVPLVNATLQCSASGASIRFQQSRYLPLGSSGDNAQMWIIPTCSSYGYADGSSASQCRLLDSTLVDMPITGNRCPQWIMPNDEGAGYYRFNLEDSQWQQLMAASASLDAREMLATVDSFEAALEAGQLSIATVLHQLPNIVANDNAEVAASLLGASADIYAEFASAATRPKLRQMLLPIYQQRLQKLGLQAQSDRNAADLQQALAEQLALLLEDPQTMAQLEPMALAYTGSSDQPAKPETVKNLSLISTAIAAQARQRGASYLQHLQQLVLASDDAVYRQRILSAMGRYDDPAQQGMLMQLALNDAIRDNEIYNLLGPQFSQAKTRAQAWQWLQQNLDAVLERIPVWRKGRVSQLAGGFCSTERATEVEAFFADRIENLQGGPRALANTLESIRLCAAKKAHFEPQLQALSET